MYLEAFLESALLILIVGAVLVALFKHIGMGSMLGLLITGIVVGPYSPGPYVTQYVEEVRHFTELGIAMLLFIIGLEMKPSRLWAMRRDVFGLGLLQIILSGLAIGFYFMFYQDSWQAALLIGMMFALSSTAFVLQLLQERGEIASKQGRAAFSILLMQDLAVIPLLAIVPIISTTGKLSADIPLWEQFTIVIGMLGLIGLFGRYLLPIALGYMARKSNKEGFLLAVLLAVFLAAWSMQKAGISIALGAFLMGMLLSGSRYRLQVQASIEPYKGILMSLFFVAVGMSIDINALAKQPGVLLQHTTVILVLKIIILFALALAFGHSRGIASRISFLLAQGGEFGFVLFASAKMLEIIDDTTFVLAIGVISISMLLTPLLVRAGDKIARHFEHDESQDSVLPPQDGSDELRVIIGGYGRVGHAVATLLHTSGIPIVVFDADPARVAQGRKDGLPVYYGDIGDPDLLSTVRVETASLVVLTIDQSDAAVSAVSHIRNSSPSVPIISRARDLDGCSRLMEAGATQAFPEAVESSLRLGGMALELINVPQDNVDQLVQGVRSDNYRLIEDEANDKDA